MQITLIKSQSLSHFTLPEKIQGQYWISDMTDEGVEIQLFSVEAVDGRWYIQSTQNAVLRDDQGNLVRSLILEEVRFYSALIRVTGENVYIYVEQLTDDRRMFRKFILPKTGVIRIGRAGDNDIIYRNPFVSSHNTELHIGSSGLALIDRNSRNGTFVDGIRYTEKNLCPGEVMYIMGLKIIIGRGFIAVNCPDRLVQINYNILRQFVKQPVEPLFDNGQTALVPSTVFYRSPRFKRDMETVQISIDPPPQKASAEQLPMLLSVGPSATMGLASLTMAGTTIMNLSSGQTTLGRSLPTIMMSVAMLCGTLVWPTVIKKYDRKKKEEREGLRQKKYAEYLKGIQRQLEETGAYQREVLNENHVPLNMCLSRIKHMQRNLWERTVSHNDFLSLRLGTGVTQLNVEFKGQQRRFALEEDNLQELQYSILERDHKLTNVPITLSLKEDQITGIIGDRARVISLVKSFIMQIATLHSYDEVKMVFIYDKAEKNQWDFVRWLPHVWSDDNMIRFIASGDVELKEISSYLEQGIEERRQNTRGSFDGVPHYVVFALGHGLSERIELLKKIYREREYQGYSVIVTAAEINNLPKETRKVIELSARDAKVYDKNDTSRNFVQFDPEYCMEPNIDRYATALANIQLDTTSETFKLPTMLTFLEMYKSGKVEHLNVLTRWKENDCTVSLQAPLGVDTDGELIKLDLHERFHGPHGLIAGTTGSGKSEFIITYILSMAINYHPDEVAFILIDYKGGGMAKTFERLPHTAGIITNLDGAEVKRSLVSINSELKRRQGMLTNASKTTGISNIDIYKYQKLYREKKVHEPLPHLLIIADEFAELKQQQSEFMSELISAARIGRSLGVHLILATQKPSGVVDDQITSNVRFKVCLKVEDRHDSIEMIKCPDAASIVNKGRFYLQIGNNELFQLGQSAWSGASYQPQDRIAHNEDNSVSILADTGRVIRQAKAESGAMVNFGSQLDNIVSYISRIAAEEKVRTRQLWCAPMSALSTLEDLVKKYGAPYNAPGVIEPIIGEYDLPEMQEQKLLTLPLSARGNVVVYGASGSGKTMFMTTLMYSLINTYTPDQVNIYALDFQSQTLMAFADAPQVGDVILSDNDEKLENLFKMLYAEIRTRRQLFQEYGGDFKTYIRTSGKTLPAIVVLIHNFTGLTEGYEGKDEQIAQLSRDANKYGIYFVVSTTSLLRYRIQQNFGQQYVLQMNDVHDYSGILGQTGGLVPSKHIGRGLFKPGDAYEFQIAHFAKTDEEFSYLRDYCRNAADRWGGSTAREVPVLPDAVNSKFMHRHVGNMPEGMLPVGVDKERLSVIAYPLTRNVMSWVLHEAAGVSLFAQGLAETASLRRDIKVIALDYNKEFEPDAERRYTYASGKDVNVAVAGIFDELLARHRTSKENPSASFDCMLCIVNSMNALMAGLEESVKNDFIDGLSHARPNFNIHFVVCDTADFFNISLSKDWAKEHSSVRDVIFVGNGIAAQYKLKIDKKPAGLVRDNLPKSFGVVLQNGEATVAKLLVPMTWREEYA